MYVERIAGPLWLRVLGFLAAAILVIFGSLLVFSIVESWGAETVPALVASLISLVLTVGLGAVLGICNRMEVRVHDGAISGYVRPLRVLRIPVTAVTDMQVTEAASRTSGGLGYRIMPERRYLLLDSGAAVRLSVKNKLVVVLRSETPENLIYEIEREQIESAQKLGTPRN